MNADRDKPELFPELNPAGALRAAFESRKRSGDTETRAAFHERTTPPPPSVGYQMQGEIARGGMGVVFKAFDRELQRDVALKVLRDELSSESRLVRRFLDEARVTARLDHPGIVPVYEVGRDAEGRAFFAMRLVRGRELRRIIQLAHMNAEGWNQTRALSVIQKVCEAMAYAHEKDVIHRDLKPSNVMVGEFGEVYVMDWGLARRIGGEETHDMRLRPATSASSSSSPSTESRASSAATAQAATSETTPTPAAIASNVSRSPSAHASLARGSPSNAEPATADVDSPIVTMDGDVLGTPCYMSPEQARGELSALGPRSDVYSVGAMLYHLLAGEMPYVPSGASVASRKVLLHLVQGPPRPLVELRPDVPAELIAISEKAMSRAAGDRYPNMLAMADDVRAFLERRVVSAYETGAWAEAKKWVQRNKRLSAALISFVAALVAGLLVSLSLKAQSDANLVRAEQSAILTETSAQVANDERDRAIQIASFLEVTLGGISTSVALGRDTTLLREMMDAAWKRVEKGDLAAAPEAELRLMLVIGSCLQDIAQFDKAEPILEQALDKARHLFANDNSLLAQLENQLGLLYTTRGKADAAEPLLVEALAMRKRVFPGDNAEVAASLENLASLRELRGDLPGAEALLRDALSMHRRLANDDSELALNLSNLGVVVNARGDLVGAEPYLRESIEIQVRVHAGDDPRLAAGLCNLASLLQDRGDIDGAEQLQRRALDMRRRLFPHDHQDLAASINNLAAVLEARGDLSGAEALFREVLEMQRRMFPGDHARVAASYGNLAVLLQDRDDVAGAEQNYRQALEMLRRLFQGDHSDIARFQHNYAQLLRRTGDMDGAEANLRDALAMEMRLFPGDHLGVANIHSSLASLLVVRGKMSEAETEFRAALEMRKHLFPGNHPDVVKSSFNLALVLEQLNGLAEADALLREALRMSRAIQPEANRDSTTAEIELGLVLSREKLFKAAEEVLLAAAAPSIPAADVGPAWRRACLQRIIDNYTAWNAAEPGHGYAELAEPWKQKLAEIEQK